MALGFPRALYQKMQSGEKPWHPMERVSATYQEMVIALTMLHMPYSQYVRLSDEERSLNLWFYILYRARENYFGMPEEDRFWWPNDPPPKPKPPRH